MTFNAMDEQTATRRITSEDFSQTELHIWSERDRLHVELRCSESDQTILEFWDDDVAQEIENGYLESCCQGRQNHEAMLSIAIERGFYLPVEARRIGEDLILPHQQFKDFEPGVWMLKWSAHMERRSHIAISYLPTVGALIAYLRKVKQGWNFGEVGLTRHADRREALQSAGIAFGHLPAYICDL